MEKKLILITKTYVYDDGTFKVEKLPIEEIAEPEEEGASAKLTQIIELLREIRNLYFQRYKGHDLSAVLPVIYSVAVKNVAERMKVNPSSVADKITRQCGKKKDDIIGLLIPFLSGADISEMKSFLVSNISKGTVADLELVDEFIAENS